ncbi:MAG: helix-turn-helix domain-containing protein [Pseudobdellovibrionaceae bacterium]
MSYETEFRSTLKRLRLAKNYSQIELVQLGKIDRTFISLLERRVRQPSFTTIVQLAIALKIKPSRLVAQVEIQICRGRWYRLKRQTAAYILQ